MKVAKHFLAGAALLPLVAHAGLSDRGGLSGEVSVIAGYLNQL